jgi:hypothetical protein
MGLVNIIQHGKQRFFLPQESPWLALERVLFLCIRPNRQASPFFRNSQAATEELTKQEPVNLPEWLIEPALEFGRQCSAAPFESLCRSERYSAIERNIRDVKRNQIKNRHIKGNHRGLSRVFSYAGLSIERVNRVFLAQEDRIVVETALQAESCSWEKLPYGR